MSARLFVVGGGAVTPVGLDAGQTCAGIRARVSRFEEILRASPFGKAQVVARIPAHSSLRSTPTEWLVNLAARAAKEIVGRYHLDASRSALIITPPETFRHSSFAESGAIGALAELIQAKVGVRFESLWQVDEGGAAALTLALHQAVRCFDTGRVKHVILGGVDSYVLEKEYLRLDAAGRLRAEGTAQGFTPGEGAAFVLLSNQPEALAEAPVAILGWGEAAEPLAATTAHYSQGRGMVEALRAAVSKSGVAESAVEWVISNGNGERYASWESVLARTRFYRTSREKLSTTYPAMSVGEMGAASGTLALLVAAHGFSRGYCPGSTAMIELSCEGQRRAACLVAGARVSR